MADKRAEMAKEGWRAWKEKLTSSRVWRLLQETISEWQEDKASRLAAALSYYTIFSLPPLLLIVVAVAGLFLDQNAIQEQVVNQAASLVGQDGAEAVQVMVESAGWSEDAGLLATVIGLATLLVGATGAFTQLQDALNTIWEVTPKPGRAIFGVVQSRFLSFSMILVIAFMLLVSLVISAGLAALGKYLESILPDLLLVVQTSNFLLSLGVITFLFAMIYKYLPDVEIEWGDVWIGAAVTALLFTGGKFALGLYLGRSGAASAYGAAGSLILILLWIYYSAQILFFGAEFTQVYARHFGSRIVPAEDAVKLTEAARTQEGIPHQETVVAAVEAEERGDLSTVPYKPKGMVSPPTRGEEGGGETLQPWMFAVLSVAVGLMLILLRRSRE